MTPQGGKVFPAVMKCSCHTHITFNLYVDQIWNHFLGLTYMWDDLYTSIHGSIVIYATLCS